MVTEKESTPPPPKERECLRCGACCVHEARHIKKQCVHFKLGKPAFCDIYHDERRLYEIVEFVGTQPFVCVSREKVNKNFPNCPYNKIEVLA
jgi:hypothetical protein